MERRVNIAVGIFLVLGVLALGYLSIKLGRVSLFGSSGLRRLRRLPLGGRPQGGVDAWRSPASRSVGWNRSAWRTIRRG